MYIHVSLKKEQCVMDTKIKCQFCQYQEIYNWYIGTCHIGRIPNGPIPDGRWSETWRSPDLV